VETSDKEATMDDKEKALLRRLLKAATAGECPNPTCPICIEKWAAIKEAEEFLLEVK